MKALEVLTGIVVGTSRFGDHLLKQKFRGIVVAALAFLCGACLAYATRRAPAPAPAPSNSPVKAAPDDCPSTGAYPAPAPAADHVPADDGEDTPELEEWKHRHGGSPLGLDYDSLSSPPKLSESKVVVWPSGRILALAGGDLHLLDTDGRVLWQRDTPHSVTDFLYVKATGVIYSRDDGNNMYILDAATGRVLRGEPRGGRAWFGAMIPYGDDTCLIVDELGSYRMGYDGGPGPTQDGVTAWRGARILWHADVPPDAEIQVTGSKIYAVTRTRTRILVKEIKPPKAAR